MIKVLLFDLSRTLLFPTDKKYKGELNKLHKELSTNPNYIYAEHFYLDEGVLNYLKRIKDKYGLYVFTSGSIQNAPEIKPKLIEVFKKVYSVEEISLSKNNPKSYEFIAKDLGITPDEMWFIDDSEKNIKAAKSAGVNVRLFRDFDKLRQELNELFEKSKNSITRG